MADNNAGLAGCMASSPRKPKGCDGVGKLFFLLENCFSIIPWVVQDRKNIFPLAVQVRMDRHRPAHLVK
jgi:hypothetical protein